MYEVENKMVAEGNYEMTKQAYIEMYKTAYEVDSPEDGSEEAYRQYLIDQIDAIEPVRDCLDACGFDSVEDMANWFQHYSDVDSLRDLLDDLEEATE
ncbi:hypothetical protein [Lactobacillus delbrueckii]|uniref:hypothetical protein n=1 Tax=Lactobacillus delbrueckii TaxID=1584 RepID=UPI001E42C78D|nr:hypothetical protein [Lactobacillus delbrueckii]MCD5445408.1 hypothetical protein [Lactobacillus delbrueckii subsp. lactis]